MTAVLVRFKTPDACQVRARNVLPGRIDQAATAAEAAAKAAADQAARDQAARDQAARDQAAAGQATEAATKTAADQAAQAAAIQATPTATGASAPFTFSWIRKRKRDDLLALPDDLVIDIVSRMDLKTGVRAAAVDYNWRALWRQSALDLDDIAIRNALGNRYEEEEIATILIQVADEHSGPIRKISFGFFWLDILMHAFNIWKEEGRFQKLDSLCLNFTGERWTCPDDEPKIVPECVFGINTLRLVKLQNCYIDQDSFFTSKRLTLLELSNVHGSPGVIPDLIKKAHNIETFILKGSPHTCNLIIKDFPFLRRLLIFLWPDASRGTASNYRNLLSTLRVRDNPTLEEVYITQTMYGPYLILNGVPKLRFIGSVGWPNRILEIGDTSFMRSAATKLSAQLANVKTACLQIIQVNIPQIVNYLYCFPQLETLHLKRAISIRKIADDGNAMLPVSTEIQCLEETLKEVLLWGFEPHDVPIDLCNYFVSKARVLDSVALVLRRPTVFDNIGILEETISHSLKLADFHNALSPNAKIKCCYDNQPTEWVDTTLSLDTEYGMDPCKFWLGSQFRVFTRDMEMQANSQQAKVMKAPIIESEGAIIDLANRAMGVEEMMPEGSVKDK